MLIFLLLFNTAQAQEESYDPARASLKEQFDHLYKKSNNYQDYKVIKRVKLNGYWKNVQDTLLLLHQEISAGLQSINKQREQIEKLEASVTSTNEENLQLKEEKASISFLGGQLG